MKLLQKSFVLVIISALFGFPTIAVGGSSGPSYLNPETDNGSFQLYYYWDLRDRESTFQVFNRSNNPVRVHVQIFVANDTFVQCNETDFFDQYTPRDTHIYNLKNIVSNDGNPTGVASFPDGTFGFAVVTVIDTSTGDTAVNPVLQGSFRIVDNAGYEYRANPAGIRPIGFTTDSFGFSYDSLGASTSADVIGIPVKWTEPTFGIPQAGPNIVAKLDPFNVDDNENDVSCNPRVFSCSATGMNLGINNSIPNSRGSSNLCISNESTGIIRLEQPVVTGIPPGTTQADFFVGFVGINNSSNMASMDSFIAIP